MGRFFLKAKLGYNLCSSELNKSEYKWNRQYSTHLSSNIWSQCLNCNDTEWKKRGWRKWHEPLLHFSYAFVAVGTSAAQIYSTVLVECKECPDCLRLFSLDRKLQKSETAFIFSTTTYLWHKKTLLRAIYWMKHFINFYCGYRHTLFQLATPQRFLYSSVVMTR